MPEVPVRVTGKVPGVAVLVAVSVSVVVPVTLPGLRVTPMGRPAAKRAMLPVKPLVGETVRALVPLAPCATVALLAERVKSAVPAAAGVSVNIAVEKRLLPTELVFSPVR